MTEPGTVTAELKIKGGRQFATINLPTSLRQVPLNRFINFLVECRNFGDDTKNQFVIMARAISDFCDHPLAEMIEAELGDGDIVALDGSLRGIFGHISNLVYKAKGGLVTKDDARFEYQGEVYQIPVIMQQALAGEYQLPALSVIETIEVAEVERFKIQKTQMTGDPNGALRKSIMDLANAEAGYLDERDPRRFGILKAGEQLANAEVEKAGDPNGSLLYSKYLKMLAIICRKDGEQLPFDDAEREAWINERAMHFKGIDAQTALDIDFFLTSILQNSGQSHNVVGFLSRQSFVLLAATRLRSGQRKPERKRTTKQYSNG